LRRKRAVLICDFSGGTPKVAFSGVNNMSVEKEPTSCAVGKGKTEGHVFCTTQGATVIEVI